MTREDERRCRRLFLWLSLAYVVFVAYGSLVPFAFTPRPLVEAWAGYRAMPYLQIGVEARADWGTNVLLFVPLAFLAAGSIHGLRWQWGWMLIVLSMCFALAAVIEFVQIFFPPRTPALNDIVAESTGAIVGALLWSWRGPRVASHVFSWIDATHQSGRWAYAFYAYLLGLFLFNLLPLDLTLSVTDLYTKWRDGRVVLVPFGFRYASLFDRFTDLALDVAAWIPVGLFAPYARPGGRRRLLLYCLGIAALLEFLQLFVYSRISDVTDIVAAAFGCWLGIMLSRFASSAESEPINPPQGSAVRRGAALTWLAALVYVAALVAYHWFPYDFRADTAFVRPRYESFWAVPLEKLFFQSELRAASNIVLKAGLFAPLGGLLAAAIVQWRGEGRQLVAWAAAGFVVLLALAIELGQVLLPAKVPDITDVLLEAAGAFVAAAVVLGPSPMLKPVSAVLQRREWLLTFGLWCVAIWAVTHWPDAPYNVRELLRPGAALLAVALLAAAIVWQSAFPVLAAKAIDGDRGTLALTRWPPLLAGHALVTYLLVRAAVPEESIHDIVGSPVLQWGPPELELLGRTWVLFAAVTWLLFGGGLFGWPPALGRWRRRQLVSLWLTLSVPILPLAHWVVVSQASTDNLTELMAGGGTVRSSLMLGTLVLLLGLNGALAARWACRRPPLWPLRLALATAVSVAVGYFLALTGTEPYLAKYDRVFSALQFLLSRDRESYATGAALFSRYVLAHLALLAATTTMHVPFIRMAQHQSTSLYEDRAGVR